jgi:hypothetical protein
VVVLGAWQPSEKDELDVVDEYDKDTEWRYSLAE